VKNILLQQLTALRSLDFGTDKDHYILGWHVDVVQTPLTYLRISLVDVLALLNLMSTWPLWNTLHQLHVTICEMYVSHAFLLNSKKKLSFCMTHLQTFTFIKPFYQQFFDEWDFLEELTSSRVRRANINVTLSAADLSRFDQSPLFIDHRCIDAHFALAVKNDDQLHHVELDKRIPRGSRSHPRQIVSAAFKSCYDLTNRQLPVSSCSPSFF
jgi:hypothetical protein